MFSLAHVSFHMPDQRCFTLMALSSNPTISAPGSSIRSSRVPCVFTSWYLHARALALRSAQRRAERRGSQLRAEARRKARAPDGDAEMVVDVEARGVGARLLRDGVPEAVPGEAQQRCASESEQQRTRNLNPRAQNCMRKRECATELLCRKSNLQSRDLSHTGALRCVYFSAKKRCCISESQQQRMEHVIKQHARDKWKNVSRESAHEMNSSPFWSRNTTSSAPGRLSKRMFAPVEHTRQHGLTGVCGLRSSLDSWQLKRREETH